MEVVKIIEQLANTSSRNEKLSILNSNSENALLSRVFRLAYSPTIRYHTKHQYDIELQHVEDAGVCLEGALDAIVDNLSTRELTGNTATVWLDWLYSRLSPKEAQLISDILQHDLRCGVNVNLINKTWPGLVETYDFLLADTDPSKIKYPALSQMKADGMRCQLFPNSHGEVQSISRNGKVIDLKGQMDDAYQLIDKGDHPVLDGELVCHRGGVELDRKTSNGILNKAIKGTISDEEADLIRFVAWDIVDTTSTIPYSERFRDLESRIGAAHIMGGLGSKILCIESKLVENEEQALQHFKELRRSGAEGTIIKNAGGVWVGKRSKDLCKFKAEVEGDFKVTGYELGTGKNSSRIGKLNIESACGQVKCSVGIFKDMDESVRDEWMESLPPIVTVLYNERITDKSRKDGTESLFLPRVTAARYDKDHCNTRSELILIEKALLAD